MTDSIAAAHAEPKLSFGRVIQGTFGVIKRNIANFLILILLLMGLPGVLMVVGGLQLSQGAMASGGGVIGLGYLILLVTSNILQGALIHATVADLNGRRATLSECLRTGMRFFLPLTAILILYGLGVFFAFFLLIVPAIMIGVAWAVAIPSEVVERTGVFGAFTRSGQLTKNNRWRIFGLLLLWTIVYTTVQSTLTQLAGLGAAPMAAASASPFAAMGPAYWIVLAISTFANALVGGPGMAVIYYELRRVKEGVGPEALASVFD